MKKGFLLFVLFFLSIINVKALGLGDRNSPTEFEKDPFTNLTHKNVITPSDNVLTMHNMVPRMPIHIEKISFQVRDRGGEHEIVIDNNGDGFNVPPPLSGRPYGEFHLRKEDLPLYVRQRVSTGEVQITNLDRLKCFTENGHHKSIVLMTRGMPKYDDLLPPPDIGAPPPNVSQFNGRWIDPQYSSNKIVIFSNEFNGGLIHVEYKDPLNAAPPRQSSSHMVIDED